MLWPWSVLIFIRNTEHISWITLHACRDWWWWILAFLSLHIEYSTEANITLEIQYSQRTKLMHMQLEQGFGWGNAWSLPRQSYKLQIQEKKKNQPTNSFHLSSINFSHIVMMPFGILKEKIEKKRGWSR